MRIFHPFGNGGCVGVRNLPHTIVSYIDDVHASCSCLRWRYIDATEMPVFIEQAQLVGDLANTEAHLLRVALSVGFGEGEFKLIEFLLAVAVRPPESRTLHRKLRELRWRQLQLSIAGSCCDL